MNMNRTQPEMDPLKAVPGSRNESLRKRDTAVSDPGTIQDYESRKMLKRADMGIRKNNKMVYISFFIEFAVLILVFSAWIILSQT